MEPAPKHQQAGTGSFKRGQQNSPVIIYTYCVSEKLKITGRCPKEATEKSIEVQ